LTCRELIDFLMDYLSGEILPDQRVVFEEHLQECPPCVAYLRTYEATIRLGKASLEPTEDELPAEVPAELVDAILAARATTA